MPAIRIGNYVNLSFKLCIGKPTTVEGNNVKQI